MTTEIRRFGKIWLRLGVSLNWGPRNNGSPNPKMTNFDGFGRSSFFKICQICGNIGW